MTTVWDTINGVTVADGRRPRAAPVTDLLNRMASAAWEKSPTGSSRTGDLVMTVSTIATGVVVPAPGSSRWEPALWPWGRGRLRGRPLHHPLGHRLGLLCAIIGVLGAVLSPIGIWWWPWSGWGCVGRRRADADR